ncbi:MAG: farnesyl-diphosphate synthase [Rickettsiales bacterium]|nr:farnesyl-diphosphate synthase [Rickettsiales bacterium]|tara:strand:+ start:1377 stop:2273 length:897 start_codon:yes stop_codon:yes gene_type:complete
MNKNFRDIEKIIENFSTDFEKKLLSFLPKTFFFSNKLDKAMKYVVKVGGKRLRPLILNEISSILGAKKENSDRVAGSIEFIHCYSLVHDDLPSMDDDDLRRGHPTCHVKFDEATAILVGDAFQSLAFEIISHKKTHKNSEVRCNLITELAKSSGAEGMVGGQMLDLEAEKKTLTLEKIFELQKLKTGELFRFSCIAPCILAEKYDELETFENFSSKLGLAFQIKDDLLDVEGNIIDVGKKTGKDLKQGKETLVSLLGVENAKKKSENLIQESIKIIEPYGEKAKNLIDLTNFIISRNK